VEYEFNRALALVVMGTLQADGFVGAFLVDPAERPLSLVDRPRLARAGGAAVLVSIHHDSVQEHYLLPWRFEGQARRYADNFSGFSLFVSLDSQTAEANRTLGRTLGEALIQAGNSPTLHHAEDIQGERRELLDADLGLYRRDTLAVLRAATMPTVLVEGGVLVNRDEEFRLRDPSWQRRFASALVAGIRAFCGTAGP
jgi:N-acetylmuramoyl-L-alanine amidase